MKRIALALVATVVLTACGSTPSGSGGAGPTQPSGASVSTSAGTGSSGTASGAPSTPGSTSQSGPSPSGSTTSTPRADLVIEVSESPHGPTHRWRLTCSPDGGDHPDPAAACATLARLPHPFAPVPKDQMCTEIYGGPQTARITGTYDGRRVDARFKRTDGCEISRWNDIQEVLVVHGGVAGS